MSDRIPGYEFRDKELLETALTHRSAGKNNYERLEFLGDSVLGFVITEILFQKYPDEPEGVLTRLRADLVKKETLARIAREYSLGELIRLGPGERKSGGWRRDSILANTLEAVIGAVYLDSDMERCRAFISSIFSGMLASLDPVNLVKDPKTDLQELLQARKLSLPVYTVIDEQGEAHKKTFTVCCEISGLDARVEAKGKSKRTAEQLAASKALKLIENNR